MRRNLSKDAQAWQDRNQQIREWLLQHPGRVDEGMWHVSINMTEVLEAELVQEMKNALRPGRASLKSRLRNLFVFIIPHRKAV